MGPPEQPAVMFPSEKALYDLFYIWMELFGWP